MEWAKSKTSRSSIYGGSDASHLGPGHYDVTSSEEALRSQAHANPNLSTLSERGDVGNRGANNPNVGPGAYEKDGGKVPRSAYKKRRSSTVAAVRPAAWPNSTPS